MSVTAEVRVDYHQFWIAPDSGIAAREPDGPPNGLIDIVDYAASIITGINMGLVNVTVASFDEAPHAVDSSPKWEDIVEASIRSTGRPLGVHALMAHAPVELQNLTTGFEAPWYRLRVHVLGRDILPNGVASRPVEYYLIELWPEDTYRAPRAHAQNDKYGESMRRSASRPKTANKLAETLRRQQQQRINTD